MNSTVKALKKKIKNLVFVIYLSEKSLFYLLNNVSLKLVNRVGRNRFDSFQLKFTFHPHLGSCNNVLNISLYFQSFRKKDMKMVAKYATEIDIFHQSKINN